MCYKYTICKHYQHDDDNNLPEACINCTYAAQVKRTSRLCQIGLLVAIVVFIATTCILY